MERLSVYGAASNDAAAGASAAGASAATATLAAADASSAHDDDHASYRLTLLTGDVFSVSKKVARHIGYVRDCLDSAEGDNSVSIYNTISPQHMALVIEFCERNLTDPIKVIARPLLSAYLTESGVPLWAAAFIDKLLPSEALTLAEEANGLRVPMLANLCYARIAAAVRRIGVARFAALVGIPETVPDEMIEDIKKKNPWAFGEETNIDAQPEDGDDA